MRKTLLIIISIVCLSATADAKIKFGLRGGLNITNMSFDSSIFDSSNRTGFYVGPTMKIGLPLGFDVDASLIYNQWEADPDIYLADDESSAAIKGPSLRRKTVALPINLRKGFGLGDKASLFIFGGPQFAFLVGDKDVEEYSYSWSNSDISINLGAGVMLVNHLELKANYNIPCGKTGEFKFTDAVTHTVNEVKSKTGGWQIGLAYYF